MRCHALFVGFGLLTEPEPGVGIGSGQPDHPAGRGQLVPSIENGVRSIQRGGQASPAAAAHKSAAGGRSPPGTRRATRCRRSATPGRRSARPSRSTGATACGEPGWAATPKPPSRRTSSMTSRGCARQRIRRARQRRARRSGRRRVDLDRLDAQHARPVGGRLGRARAVAVIGEDDELQARAAAAAARSRRGFRCRPSATEWT